MYFFGICKRIKFYTPLLQTLLILKSESAYTTMLFPAKNNQKITIKMDFSSEFFLKFYWLPSKQSKQKMLFCERVCRSPSMYSIGSTGALKMQSHKPKSKTTSVGGT